LKGDLQRRVKEKDKLANLSSSLLPSFDSPSKLIKKIMSIALYIKGITRVIDACLRAFGEDSATSEGFQNAPRNGLAKSWKVENTTTIWSLHTLSRKENGITCAHLGTTPGPVACWKGKLVKEQVYPSRLRIFKSAGQRASCGYEVNPLTNFFKAPCSR